MAAPSADGPGVPGAGAARERSRTPPPDPRDSAAFPWVKVIVWDGDLTEPIHPDAWVGRAPDRFRFHRLDDDSSSAMYVHPWDHHTVGDVQSFAARKFNRNFGACIRQRHWHMELPDGTRVSRYTNVWEAFERRSNVYLARHDPDTPPDVPEWTHEELAELDAAEQEARHQGMEDLIGSDGDLPGHDD